MLYVHHMCCSYTCMRGSWRKPIPHARRSAARRLCRTPTQRMSHDHRHFPAAMEDLHPRMDLSRHAFRNRTKWAHQYKFHAATHDPVALSYRICVIAFCLRILSLHFLITYYIDAFWIIVFCHVTLPGVTCDVACPEYCMLPVTLSSILL